MDALRQSRAAVALSLLAFSFLDAAVPCAAVTFQLNFQSDASNPNDPGDAGLQAIVQEAANRWSDIIEDDYAMTLNVSYYANDASGNGPCGMNVRTACAGIVSSNAARNRTLEGNLRFYANRSWYIDPSPSTDSEFDLVQTRYVDLSPAQQTAGYSGVTLEPLLEVGFRGNNNGSDPNVAGNVDMLSTALHEIGHHLGVTNQFSAATMETADDDYDLPPSLLGGGIMAVEAPPGQEYHFVDSFPLMSNQGSRLGTRRTPAAADVLAMAAVSDWVEIDLPRQDFLQGTSWATPGNWLGNQVPDADDDAFVRREFNDVTGTGDVVLDQNAVVRNLVVAMNSNLRTGTSQLTVTDAASIRAEGGADIPQIVVEAGGLLDTGHLAVDGGHLRVEADGRVNVSGTITNENGGMITGAGTIAAGGAELLNEAVVSPGLSTGMLTIEGGDFQQGSAGTLHIELGGTASSEFDALAVENLANLDGTLSVELVDEFTPAPGDAFVIITAPGGVLGNFSSTSFPELNNQMFDVVYENDAVALIVASSLPGDLDDDGDADGLDLLHWQRGDADAPPSASDLDNWQANYGAAGGNAVTRAVPEASTALALLAGALPLACSRRKFCCE